MSNNETEFEAADVDVEDWIDGVSFLQAKHTIYRNPAMFAEYQPLLARIDVLEQEIDGLTAQDEDDVVEERALAGEATLTSAPTADRALGEKPVEPPRVAELREELEKLTRQANDMWEKYAADVEVWRLRKLEQDELKALHEELGGPPAEPRRLSKDAKPQAVTAHVRRFDAWLADSRAYTRRYNVRCVALATIGVTVQGVDRGKVTVEQVERVLTRPGGEDHVLELVDVIKLLSVEGVDIVAPHRSGA